LAFHGVEAIGLGNGYFPSEGNGLILGLDELIPSFDTDAVHEGSISNIDLGGQLTVAVWVNVDNPIQDSLTTIRANASAQEKPTASSSTAISRQSQTSQW